ncbi:MAG: hypothetical protein LLG05_18395 [Porphyromonadaceae bacterium]|nr:hypothetical protein [Porphyromonadaceae bacterium]
MEDRSALKLKTVNGNIFLLWLENGVVKKVFNRYSVLSVNHVKEWLTDERDSRYLLRVGEILPQITLLRKDVESNLIVNKPTMLVIISLESELQLFIEWLNMAKELFQKVDIVPIFTRNTEQMMKKNEISEQYPDLLNAEYTAQYSNLKKRNLEWMQTWPELLSPFDNYPYYIDVDLQLQGFLGETPLVVLLNADGIIMERWQCLGNLGDSTEKSEQLIAKIKSAIAVE